MKISKEVRERIKYKLLVLGFMFLSLSLIVLFIIFNNLSNDSLYIEKDKIEKKEIKDFSLTIKMRKKENKKTTISDTDYLKNIINKYSVDNNTFKEEEQFYFVHNNKCLMMLDYKNNFVKQNNAGLCPKIEDVINDYNNILNIDEYIYGTSKDIISISYNGMSGSKFFNDKMKNIYENNINLNIYTDDFNFSFRLKTINSNININIYKIPFNTIVRFNGNLYTYKGINEFFTYNNTNIKIINLAKFNEKFKNKNLEKLSNIHSFKHNKLTD